ncbi:MAG: Asp-tRNA(Asn)/Glu-tRNA(Gln) amidotransferase subunit GatC [Promethearchaeota archaeon]
MDNKSNADGKKTKLTVKDTQKIAKLARIELTEEDLEKFTHQLNNILDYFEKISELDDEIKDVEPRTHPTDIVNSFREDVVKPGLSREDALKNANEKKDGFFKSQPIL